MSSVQLAEFVLWKSIKQRREDGFSLPNIFREEIVFPNEMICRVCTRSADIPITDKVNGMYISSALQAVSCVSVSSSDSYPKYVCKTCLEEIKVALSFKKKCELSNYLFHQTQQKHPQDSQPVSAVMVRHDFTLIIHQMKKRRLSLLKHGHKSLPVQKRCNLLLSHEQRVHKREKHKLFNEVHKVVLNDDGV